MVRNRYEVAIFAYFVRGGLENNEAAHLAHYIGGTHCNCMLNFILCELLCLPTLSSNSISGINPNEKPTRNIFISS